MLKKAKVKVKRMGLKSYKALFSIRVLKVTLPWEPSFADDPNVSVSFERGGKMAKKEMPWLHFAHHAKWQKRK